MELKWREGCRALHLALIELFNLGSRRFTTPMRRRILKSYDNAFRKYQRDPNLAKDEDEVREIRTSFAFIISLFEVEFIIEETSILQVGMQLYPVCDEFTTKSNICGVLWNVILGQPEPRKACFGFK